MSAVDALPTRESAGRRGRGRTSKVLASVAVVLAVLVGLDRLAASVAARSLADRVQSTQRLTVRPGAAIRGFPFVTQVLAGRYREVDLWTRAPVTEGGVRISSARVRLRGVRVGFSEAVRGGVSNVPVQSGSGTVLLTYDDLNRLLTQAGGGPVAVTLSAAGAGRLRVTGPFGLSLETGAQVTDGLLRIQPDAGDLAALPAPVRDVAVSLLANPVPLPDLPFNLRIRSGRLTARGLEITADAGGVAFPTRR